MKQGFPNKLIELTRTNQKAVVFILCLILATMFWVANSLSRTFESELTLPLAYRNIPFNKELDSNLPKEITFVFKESGYNLFYLYLNNQPDSVIIDVAGSEISGNKFSIRSSNLFTQLDTDIKPVKIVPEIIAPGLITSAGKRIPVIPDYKISFRSRYGSENKLIIVPDSVTITGPEQLLAKINSVRTKPIILDDLHQPVFESIYLNELPFNDVAISEKFVYYYLPVSEFTEGEFTIPVELPSAQRKKITLAPSHVKVRFVADMKRFSRISPSDFQAVAEVPFPETPNALTVELKRKPLGIGKVYIEPGTVKYFINE